MYFKVQRAVHKRRVRVRVKHDCEMRLFVTSNAIFDAVLNKLL